MHKSSLVLMLALSVAASAQTSTTTTTTHKSTTHKSTTAKSAVKKISPPATTAAPAGPPKAIIHTSMGDIHCTLMPDKAPIGVANFVGLATGTKDWTDPKSGAKKH